MAMFGKPMTDLIEAVSSPTIGGANCKTALAAATLRAGNSIRLQVLGSSMLPAMWPGDVVHIDSSLSAAIAPGDIVLCERDDRFFVHRLIANSESENGIHWTTRGDSMSQNDPLFSEVQLLGRVSSIRRGDRDIIPKRKLSKFRGRMGWLLCHSDPLRNLALRLHALRTSRRAGSLQAQSTQGQLPLPSYSHQKGG
jgi:signal peptidase I